MASTSTNRKSKKQVVTGDVHGNQWLEKNEPSVFWGCGDCGHVNPMKEMREIMCWECGKLPIFWYLPEQFWKDKLELSEQPKPSVIYSFMDGRISYNDFLHSQKRKLTAEYDNEIEN